MTDNSFLHTFVSFYLKRNIKDMLAREDEEARHIWPSSNEFWHTPSAEENEGKVAVWSS